MNGKCLLNHFAKVCRKQKTQKAQNPKKNTVNTIEEEFHPEDSVIFLSLSGLYESDYSRGDDNLVATIHNELEKTETLNMPIKIGEISTTQLVESGSACSILKKSLAAKVVINNSYAIWVREINNQQLWTFSTQLLPLEVKIRTPVTRNSWHT